MGAGIFIQGNLYRQFPPVLLMKAFTLQGQTHKRLHSFDERRFHMERASQLQVSADDVFESATCLRLTRQCFRRCFVPPTCCVLNIYVT